MRFYLIDNINEINYGKYIKGTKCITLSDDVFNEHFPGYPVFPGSLIIEGLAQLGGAYFQLMMKKENQKIKQPVLSIVKKMKFRKATLPGCCLTYFAEILSYNEDFGVVKASAKVGDEVRAEGELTFMFVNIDSDEIEKSRKNLFNIMTKDMVETCEDSL